MRKSVNTAFWKCLRNRRQLLWGDDGTAGCRRSLSSSTSSSSSSSGGGQNGGDGLATFQGRRNQEQVVDLRFKGIERSDIKEGDSSLRRLYGTGFHESRCSFTCWSPLRSSRSLHCDRRGKEQWKSGDVLRMLSTKPTAEEDGGRENSGATEGSPGQEPMARPKTIDDFKHEEIEGPTVERDMSDTANQLRSSQHDLTTVMTNLQSGFMTLGCVQLLATIWESVAHDVGLIQGLSQDLAFVVSFFLAYLLRHYVSAILFFRRVEERGRMKILTLSLQVTKMSSKFFRRSWFMVRVVTAASLCILLVDIWRFYFGA